MLSISSLGRKIKKYTMYILITVLVLTTLSSVGYRQERKENQGLKKENTELRLEKDSLESIIVNDLSELKDKENQLIRSVLSLSDDTSYTEVDPSNIIETISYQEQSFEYISMIVEVKWDSINSIPFGIPVSSADMSRISDGYGWRKHPILNKWIYHDGIDISAPVGVGVYSTSAGVVEYVKISEQGYGNKVVINHDYGYKTVYAHLNDINVKEGDSIQRGDVIGTVGTTGLTTGPHLHYEVLHENIPVNPNQFIYNSMELAIN